MTAVLRHAGFRRLALVWTASNLADSALFLTLAIWVKELTGSDGAAGLVFAALGLPVLLAPFAGHLADRMSRRRLVAAADVLAAAVILLLLAVRSADGVWLVYLVTFAYATIGHTTAAAQSGLVKDLVPDNDLGAANGLLSTVDQGMRLIMPLLGAGLYVALGVRPLVVLTSLFFVVAALLMMSLRMRETPPTPVADRDSFWVEVTAGFRHVWRTDLLFGLTIVLAVAVGATGVSNITIFAALEQGLRLGPEFLGIFASIQGVGSVLGGLTAATVISRLGERATVGVGLVLLALGIATTATTSLVLICVGIVGAGLGIPWTIVAFSTVCQRLTPPTLQGRTSAATNLALNVPQTAATLVAAAVIVLVDYRIMIAVTAFAVLVAAAGCLPRRRRRAVEPPERALEPTGSA